MDENDQNSDEPDEKDDEVAEHVRRSTEASGVPEKVTDHDTLHALAALFSRMRRSRSD